MITHSPGGTTVEIHLFPGNREIMKTFLSGINLVIWTQANSWTVSVTQDHLFMHLTNYSVNKHSETYEKSGTVDTGSKRSLRYFNQYLRHHDYDVGALWQSITDVIIKTLIVAQPHVLHAYRMCRPGQPVNSDSVCFEILGFDIIVDRKLRPWLLEVWVNDLICLVVCVFCHCYVIFCKQKLVNVYTSHMVVCLYFVYTSHMVVFVF